MTNWDRERWRKLYLRESQQWRLCSVFTRGLRDYLIRVAEDDGRLVRAKSASEAARRLMAALQAHEVEVELGCDAVEALLRDEFLMFDGDWLVVVNLPEAQGDEIEPTGVRTGAGESREERRARKARERQQAKRERDAKANPSRSEVDTPRDIGAHGPRDKQRDEQRDSHAPLSLPPSHSPSASPLPASQKSQPEEAEAASDAAAGERDEQRDSQSVTERDTERDAPQNFEQAMALPICVRADYAQRNEHQRDWLEPQKWPEVIAVAEALAEASGARLMPLAAPSRDAGVRAVLVLYASGWVQRDVCRAARQLPREPAWAADGKRRGLSWLTPEVARRALAAAEDHDTRADRSRRARASEETPKASGDSERVHAAEVAALLQGIGAPRPVPPAPCRAGPVSAEELDRALQQRGTP